jgi:N-acetylglucosaminyldiphosphoundecaprenol N-acetyl-beta-D-mannosaminyltransferase
MSPPLSKERIAEDFGRDVWCLFGLPVDNLTMELAKRLVREKTKREGNYVLSTINVNWVVQSLKDPDFRMAIINSDIVTIDGRPLLWLAKMLGFPMREVVAGSSLIEELLSDTTTGEPLTLYIFGGEDGVADRAMRRVNKKQGGLGVVGYCSPGFGTVEQMSNEKIIADINASKPDILLVALGAKKGMQWIDQNRDRLDAKIISHLGATINFLAGTVKRAPKWMRKMGIEWLWRIYQEPKLAKRYLTDGVVLLRALLRQLSALAQFLWLRKKTLKEQAEESHISPAIEIVTTNKDCRLNFGRYCFASGNVDLRRDLQSCAASERDLFLDFSKTELCDGNFYALLILLEQYQLRIEKKLVYIGVPDRLRSISRLFSCDSFPLVSSYSKDHVCRHLA